MVEKPEEVKRGLKQVSRRRMRGKESIHAARARKITEKRTRNIYHPDQAHDNTGYEESGSRLMRNPELVERER